MNMNSEGEELGGGVVLYRNSVELDWDLDRVIKNLEAISVIIYQELTTDIRGEPL